MDAPGEAASDRGIEVEEEGEVRSSEERRSAAAPASSRPPGDSPWSVALGQMTAAVMPTASAAATTAPPTSSRRASEVGPLAPPVTTS